MKRLLTALELGSTLFGVLVWLVGSPSLTTVFAALQWVVLAVVLAVSIFGVWLGVKVLIAQRQPPYE
jgi:hypothetical protein